MQGVKRMKKLIHRVLCVSLAVVLFLSVPTVGYAAGTDTTTALNKAEDYLTSNIVDPVIGSVGGEWSVIAMAREGRLTEAARAEYLKNLQYVLEKNKGVLHRAKYTEYSRVVLALTAIGTDPANFKGYNLLKPLADFNKVTKQGINGAVFALIAFDSRDYKIPKTASGKQTTRDNLVDFILKAELPQGGWGLLDHPDDMTAMAIQALVPYKERADVKAAIERALNTLSNMQKEDGGFSTQSGSESISQAVIALSSYDVSLLSDKKFMKNGKSLLDALLQYQNANGSFIHTKGNGEDIMATDQATLALIAYKRALNHQNLLFDMSDVTLRKDIPELEYIPGVQGNASSVKIPDLSGQLSVQGTKTEITSDGEGIESAGKTEDKKDKKTKKTKKTKKVVRKKRVKKKKPVKGTQKIKKNKKQNETTQNTSQQVKEHKSMVPVIVGSLIALFVVICIITKIVLEKKRSKLRRRRDGK